MSRFEFTKKEVEDYLVSISYKKCKIKEMLYFYKNKELQNYYKEPQSYHQISSIMKIIDKYSNLGTRESNIDIFSRLCQVLCRKLNTRNYFKVVDKLRNRRYRDDRDIFNFIETVFNNYFECFSCWNVHCLVIDHCWTCKRCPNRFAFWLYWFCFLILCE